MSESETRYPYLPFTPETDLEDMVVKTLSEIPDYYSSATFSTIPAIRQVRKVTDCTLWAGEEYVEKIYKKHLDKIEAARVVSLQRWNEEHE